MFNNGIIVENSSVLMVSMTTRADTGYYTCTATNIVGTSSSTAYLNVFCKYVMLNKNTLGVKKCRANKKQRCKYVGTCNQKL